MELSIHALRTKGSNADLVQGERSTIRHRGDLHMSDKFASGTKNHEQTYKQTNYLYSPYIESKYMNE